MNNDSGLDIFLTVSLNHSELNAVKYLADKEQISLEVALRGNIDDNIRSLFLQKTSDCLAIYYKLSGIEPLLMELTFIEISGVTFLRLLRDVNTLSDDEIGLLLLLLREQFNNLMVGDNNSIIAKDSFKQRLKKNLLQRINQNSTAVTSFLAYRKEGRVFVYNQ